MSFTWTSKGGVEITLPDLNTLPAGVFRRHRKLEPIDFVFTVLEETADEASIERLDTVPLPEVNDLFEAWQKAGEATVGESSGSST